MQFIFFGGRFREKLNLHLGFFGATRWFRREQKSIAVERIFLCNVVTFGKVLAQDVAHGVMINLWRAINRLEVAGELVA